MGDNNKSIGEELKLVCFSLDEALFGIDILQVQEIIRTTAVTRLVHVADFVEGIINLRGDIIPIINLRERLGIKRKDYDAATRVIIVNVDDKLTGLVVDSVSEVITVNSESIEAPSVITSSLDLEYIRGIVRVNGKLLTILDLYNILYAPLGRKGIGFERAAPGKRIRRLKEPIEVIDVEEASKPPHPPPSPPTPQFKIRTESVPAPPRREKLEEKHRPPSREIPIEHEMTWEKSIMEEAEEQYEMEWTRGAERKQYEMAWEEGPKVEYEMAWEKPSEVSVKEYEMAWGEPPKEELRHQYEMSWEEIPEGKAGEEYEMVWEEMPPPSPASAEKFAPSSVALEEREALDAIRDLMEGYEEDLRVLSLLEEELSAIEVGPPEDVEEFIEAVETYEREVSAEPPSALTAPGETVLPEAVEQRFEIVSEAVDVIPPYAAPSETQVAEPKFGSVLEAADVIPPFVTPVEMFPVDESLSLLEGIEETEISEIVDVIEAYPGREEVEAEEPHLGEAVPDWEPLGAEEGATLRDEVREVWGDVFEFAEAIPSYSGELSPLWVNAETVLEAIPAIPPYEESAVAPEEPFGGVRVTEGFEVVEGFKDEVKVEETFFVAEGEEERAWEADKARSVGGPTPESPRGAETVGYEEGLAEEAIPGSEGEETKVLEVVQVEVTDKYKPLEDILNKYGRKKGALNLILQDMRRVYEKFTPDLIRYVAEQLDIPLSRINEIVTFYPEFENTMRL
ncbi:MAG: chemotaxis protein CheW [bacterium]